MPVSRIAFALADLRTEIEALLPEECDPPIADIAMSQPVCDLVIRELEYHHGAKLQRDDKYRGPGTAVRYAGMRLVRLPPGNR